MKLDYETYKNIIDRILNYINENELWKKSINFILKRKLLSSEKDVYYLRNSARNNEINENLACKILISHYGKIDCTNRLSETKWIDNSRELKYFMNRNNEKLIEHGKIVRLYKP